MNEPNPIVDVVRRVREQAPKGFMPQDLFKIKTVAERLMQHKEGLMAVISIAKVCPDAVDGNALTQSCQQHNPLLLDELMDFSNIDKVVLQEKILRSLQVGQAMARVQMWYPSKEPPTVLQETLASKVYNKSIAEMTEGPLHKRELQEDTGVLLVQALTKIGTTFTDPACVFQLLRASHYVLRGMARAQELHHHLDDKFPEHVLSSAWTYAKDEGSTPSLVNAVALTLSNRDVFPEALNFVTLNYPEFTNIVAQGWNLDSKDLTKYIGALRKDADMRHTVVTRGAKADDESFGF